MTGDVVDMVRAVGEGNEVVWMGVLELLWSALFYIVRGVRLVGPMSEKESKASARMM